jgi:hypothetical protein
MMGRYIVREHEDMSIVSLIMENDNIRREKEILSMILRDPWLCEKENYRQNVVFVVKRYFFT